MEHTLPSESFHRENRTTFSEIPFIPEIFQRNEPKTCVPWHPNRNSRNFLVNGKRPMTSTRTNKQMRTLRDCVTIIVELRFLFYFFFSQEVNITMLFLKCAAQRAFSVSGSWRIFHKLQFQNKLRFSERLSQMLAKTNSDFKTHTHPQKKKSDFEKKKKN